MRARTAGAKVVFFGSLLVLSSPILAPQASASEPVHHRPVRHAVAHHIPAAHHVAASQRLAATYHYTRPDRHAHQAAWHGKPVVHYWHYAARGGISCVPFARRDSGIDLKGNAWEWWGHAAGVYARGHVPQVGSVLAFRSNPRMRLGHVAVVSRVINPREVEIDQANWSSYGMRGGIAHNVPVVDVSEANDWSAVRVGLGRSGDFGAVYPTYGFIYNRPDTGVQVAQTAAPAPTPALNPAPRDLRPVAERPWQTYEEVAQAPPVVSQAPEHASGLRRGAVGAIDPK